MTKKNPQPGPDAPEPNNGRAENSDFAQEDWIALDHLLEEESRQGPRRAPRAGEPQTIEVEALSEPAASASSDEPHPTVEDDAASSGAQPESTRDDTFVTEDLRDKNLQEEDIQDEIMILGVTQRHIRVVPGESAELAVTLLNNGHASAPFSLQFEGYVQEEWIAVEPAHFQLRPGERGHFRITLSLPRLATSRAGTFPLHISARSPSYPQRRSRISTRLTVEPFTAFSLGELHPAALSSFWHASECTTLLPITNGSNTEVRVFLEGSDGRSAKVGSPGQGQQRTCQIEFLLPGAKAAHSGHVVIALAPGQTVHAAVRVSPRRRRPFGLRRTIVPFRITGWVAGAGGARDGAAGPSQWGTARTATGRMSVVPLVGPGTMTAAVGCGLIGTLAAGIATLAVLFTFLLPALRAPQSASAPPAAEPAAVEIVVKIAEPVPTPGDGVPAVVAADAAAMPTAAIPTAATPTALAVLPAVPSAAAAPVDRAPAGAVGASTLGPEGVPLVQPDMVTAPGQPVAAQEQPLGAEPAAEPTPVVVASPGDTQAAAPPDRTTMTYEQMFRAVGDEYGLDWRLLAAQAYVESGFNPVALGSQGDLGLMQVLPATWQEWAPQVSATDPFDSYSNVRVAAAYLDYLRTLLDQRNGHSGIEWMLVAYNWGPNQLQTFLNSGSTWNDLEEQRRNYANDILGIAESLPQ